MTSEPSTSQQILSGTDGSSLWCSRKDKDHAAFLKFYSDGTVIWTFCQCTVDDVPRLERWFHKPRKESGTYLVSGSSIKFSLPTLYSPQVDHEGVIQGHTMHLTEYCHRDRKASKDSYALLDQSSRKQLTIADLPDPTKDLTGFDLFQLLGDRPIALNVAVMFQTTKRTVGGHIGLVDLYFENGIVLWNVRIAGERMVTIPAAYKAFPIKTVGVANLERHVESPAMRAEMR